MRLRESLDQTPSHAKNSNNIVLTLKSLNELDRNMFTLAADDIAMHPHINTEEGLTFLTLSLDELMFKVEPN